MPLHLRGCVPGLSKVRLSSLTVLISFGSSSTTPRSGQNPSDSLCTGLWVPFRVFGIRFGPVLGPNPIRNRRFPAGSFEMFGARAAQPRRASSYPSYVYDWRLEAGGQRKNHSGFSRLDHLAIYDNSCDCNLKLSEIRSVSGGGPEAKPRSINGVPF